jgi:hypothetical protein
MTPFGVELDEQCPTVELNRCWQPVITRRRRLINRARSKLIEPLPIASAGQTRSVLSGDLLASASRDFISLSFVIGLPQRLHGR